MDGKLEKIDDAQWRLRFVRTLRHPPEKVWRALTDTEHIEAWFPTTIEGDRETGAKLRFSFTDDAAPPFDGEMLEYDPPSVLEFRWGDDDVVRFELRGVGDGTELTFLNTFAEEGKAARDAAGWHTTLDLLSYVLAGEKPPWDSDDHWQELHPGYVEEFGPAASTIGPPDWHPLAESEQS